MEQKQQTLKELVESAQLLGIEVDEMNFDEKQHKLDSFFWDSGDIYASVVIDENEYTLMCDGDVGITYKNNGYYNNERFELIDKLNLNDEKLGLFESQGIFTWHNNNWFSVMVNGETLDTFYNFSEALWFLIEQVLQTLKPQQVELFENGGVQTDFHVIEMDETFYWDKKVLQKFKINSIMRVYLFDKNRHTYCCEMTYSYWLMPLYANIIMENGTNDNDLSYAHDFVDNNDGDNESGYYNHYDIDAESMVKVDKNFKYIIENDYEKKLAFVLEHVRSNHYI